MSFYKQGQTNKPQEHNQLILMPLNLVKRSLKSNQAATPNPWLSIYHCNQFENVTSSEHWQVFYRHTHIQWLEELNTLQLKKTPCKQAKTLAN